MTVDGHTMYFTYDASGTPMSLTYDGVTYYYVTNLQGDVVAILNGSGAKVVSYSYDAWGNLLSTTGTLATTVGFYNPLRYRGYVYDPETELYYLQSRYYNPEMGRFINADVFVSTGQGLVGNHMFAYCGNNPVVFVDTSGNSFAVIIGFNFNLFSWGMVGSINLVSTDQNFGVQYSYYFSDDPTLFEKNKGQTFGVDIGGYLGVQITEKQSMEELTGLARSTGGDIAMGVDVLTDANGHYLGWQFGASEFSLNAHTIYTNTETLFSFQRPNWGQKFRDIIESIE